MESLPTLIWRHRKENLKKCSLHGLEKRSDLLFFSYPEEPLPIASVYLLLHIDGPPLSKKDASHGLILLDGTWKYAEKMVGALKNQPLILRSIPGNLMTAYPRRQEGCSDPARGLASVEALFAAYSILGRDTEGLLDSYHWKELFIEKNRSLLGMLDRGFPLFNKF